MKRVFLGWESLPFSNYAAALTALGASVERRDPDACGALLLPGGGDVHPRRFGGDAALAQDVDEARDEYELALFQQFYEQGKPIFGICRGAQLVNVALGGTLRCHIEGHSRTGGADRFHAVSADDALLRGLYGDRFLVNSAHHQAVDRLGAGLRVAARADDGVIEAVRHASRPIFAVQWHPERLTGGVLSRRATDGAALLKAFLAAVPDARETRRRNAAGRFSGVSGQQGLALRGKL